MQALLTKISLNCGGRLISLDQPKIMGILNATPDSFFGSSRVNQVDEVLRKAELMLNQGADFLDIGGQSTRPGAEKVSMDEELKRVEPAISALQQNFPEAILSIDTFYGSVAKHAIEAGVSIVNDVSGFDLDEKMLEVLAKYQIPYVLMHYLPHSSTISNPQNMVLDICSYFTEKITILRDIGIKDIILDPGFGFGKSLEANYSLMRNLDQFKIFELPVLVGISRKSMIQKVIGLKADMALNGTTALHMIALERGAKILRVHDVTEAKECIQLHKSLFPEL